MASITGDDVVTHINSANEIKGDGIVVASGRNDFASRDNNTVANFQNDVDKLTDRLEKQAATTYGGAGD